MNNRSKNKKNTSLLDAFLSISESIDKDKDKAKMIIKEEGLDPEELEKEGLNFIKALQEKNNQEVVEQSTSSTELQLTTLVKKLIEAGVPKTFLEKRIIPLAFTNKGSPEKLNTLTSYLSAVFGWKEEEIWSQKKLQFSSGPAMAAMFKAPGHSNPSQIKIYSHYVYYLATVVAKSCIDTNNNQLPEDIEEFKIVYLKKYKRFELDYLIRYVWELGFCVLPLNDPGVFHGACWNINGKRIIVLKQNTKHHARWIFDLLHETYHALAHLDEPNTSLIETNELNPYIDNQSTEEREANTFARQVLFGDKSEDLIDQCIQQSKGKIQKLKDAVITVAHKENIREDTLANLIAFRLSLTNQNWWGPATSLQISSPDPFSIVRQALIDNISIDKLSYIEYNALQIAISND